jgi:hypothetical protein
MFVASVQRLTACADGCKRMAASKRAAAGRAALVLDTRLARELQGRRGGGGEAGGRRELSKKQIILEILRDQTLPVQQIGIVREVGRGSQRVQRGCAIRREKVDVMEH